MQCLPRLTSLVNLFLPNPTPLVILVQKQFPFTQLFVLSMTRFSLTVKKTYLPALLWCIIITVLHYSFQVSIAKSTFHKHDLPHKVYISGKSYHIRPHRPPPHQCQKCWYFGHPVKHEVFLTIPTPILSNALLSPVPRLSTTFTKPHPLTAHLPTSSFPFIYFFFSILNSDTPISTIPPMSAPPRPTYRTRQTKRFIPSSPTTSKFKVSHSLQHKTPILFMLWSFSLLSFPSSWIPLFSSRPPSL